MKNIFLTVVFIFATTFSFATTNINNEEVIDGPHFILTSCGVVFAYNDAGLTIDEQFDLAEAIDDLFCGAFFAYF